MRRIGNTAGRKYVRVGFEVPADKVDDAAGILVAEGAMGCSVDGDHRSAHRRKTLRLDAYFDRLGESRLAAIRKRMTAARMLARNGRTPPREDIADPGWATAWMDRFEPLKIGRRLLIVPPWDPGCVTERIRIVLNPGQAFGTGHHATTYGALRAIEDLCAARRFEHALDVGTGSGVLAIAMRLIGVGRVTAIDIDKTALENARENAALNSLSGKIRFGVTPLERLTRRFDLITANILSSTLIEIADDLRRRLAQGGRLVLGGILNREVIEVLTCYAPPLRCVSVRRDRGWSTLVMAR